MLSDENTEPRKFWRTYDNASADAARLTITYELPGAASVNQPEALIVRANDRDTGSQADKVIAAPHSAYKVLAKQMPRTITKRIVAAETPPSGTTYRSYYYAGTSRIALRVQTHVENDLYYLLTDHLGSSSVVVDANGANPVYQYYKPWGEIRYTSGTMPTDYAFTGQRSEMDSIGLMYYNARWYDPRIISFNKPDTLIPDPNNPLDFNRYGYARYNPLKYTDPTGHAVDAGCQTVGCGTYKPKPRLNLGYSSPSIPSTISSSGSGDTYTTPAFNPVRNIPVDKTYSSHLSDLYLPLNRCDAFDTYVEGQEGYFVAGNFHSGADHGLLSAHLTYQASYGTNYYETHSVVTINESFELPIQVAHSPSASTYAVIATEQGEVSGSIPLGTIEANYSYFPRQHRSQQIAILSSSPVKYVYIRVKIAIIGIRKPHETWYQFPSK